jgi:predicted protein tyrosine phosphatase
LIDARAPERIVSLADPGHGFPDAGPDYVGRHLCLSFHDATVTGDEDTPPTAEHAATLVSFLAAWTRRAPLLVHCRAGIGRSTATAFIAACLHNPNTDEHAIACGLRRASPLARPNPLLVELADVALGRHGRMIAAVEQTGRGLSWDEVARALHANGEGVPFELASTF